MTAKRFTITQKEDYFYVRDEVNKKPMGMFEFKQDEFPVFACFHMIIDLMNELHEENQALKSDRARYEEECRLDVFKELMEENEQLKQENQEYKSILQDMGMLMSDDEVKNIRNEMANKFLKSLFKSNGFDVDIDCTDGFTIIPKGDDDND